MYKILVKLGHVVSEIYERRETGTDTRYNTLHRSEVTIQIKRVFIVTRS